MGDHYNCPDPSSRGQMVVGIDFGTTFTSCSFIYIAAGTNVKSIDIQNVNSWSSFPGKIINNIPSKLCYMIHKSDGALQQISDTKYIDWGLGSKSVAQQAQLRRDYPELELKVFKWFKLHLKRDFSGMDAERSREFQRERELEALPSGVSAVEAATEFLRCFTRDVKAFLDKRGSPYLNRDRQTMRYILTVPSTWSQAERDLTRQAAIEAGLLSEGGSLTLIKEPEAAAFASIQKHARETPDSPLVGDGFIVCDAGGGTVDLGMLQTFAVKVLTNLVGYIVEAVEPLRISEASQSTGGFCGSSFLNNRFKQYLRNKYPALFEHSKLVDCVMDEFENNIKTQFGCNHPDEQETHILELLEGPAYAGIYETLKVDPSYPTIEVSSKDLVDHIFGPVIDEISNLVGEQIIEMSSKMASERVKFVYLVGGFGENAYLQRRLESDFQEYASTRHWSPQLKCLGEAQQMVTRGAVYYGAAELDVAGAPRVQSKIAQATYGTAFDEPVNRPFPDGRRIVRALNGAYMMKNTFHWALCKGENYEEHATISFNRHFTFPFYEDSDEYKTWQWQRTITLYTVLGNNAPEYLDQPDKDVAHSFCTLTITQDQCPRHCLIPVGRAKHLIKFSMSLVFLGASLRYTISPQDGHEVSVEDINYSDMAGIQDINDDMAGLRL